MIAILHVFTFFPLLFSQIEMGNPKGACFDLPPKVVCNQQVYYCHWVCTNAPFPHPTSHIVSFYCLRMADAFALGSRWESSLAITPCSHHGWYNEEGDGYVEEGSRNSKADHNESRLFHFLYFSLFALLSELPETDSTRSYSSCFAPAPFVHFSKLLSKTRNHKKERIKRKKRDPSSISSQSVFICWLHVALNLIATRPRYFCRDFIMYTLLLISVTSLFFFPSLLLSFFLH